MIDDFHKLLGCLRDLSRPELLTLDAAVRGILSAPPPVSTEPPSHMPLLVVVVPSEFVTTTRKLASKQIACSILGAVLTHERGSPSLEVSAGH